MLTVAWPEADVNVDNADREIEAMVRREYVLMQIIARTLSGLDVDATAMQAIADGLKAWQIGRASCRERV